MVLTIGFLTAPQKPGSKAGQLRACGLHGGRALLQGPPEDQASDVITVTPFMPCPVNIGNT
jgi:hypothetical protein